MAESDEYNAELIAEGALPATEEQYWAAWQHLVDTGAAWRLQGFFGRTALAMIQGGWILPPVQGSATNPSSSPRSHDERGKA